MTAILEGVRILEVAEHTFVPAAGAVLADLGADVVKIEHVERGDAMRGLASSGVMTTVGSVHTFLEHSNRGKRSLGLDLSCEDGREILYKLAAASDVFLTNKLPGVRQKLRIDLEHIRAANPDIIYTRGTGQGERGPDADKGSYDSLAFWARSSPGFGCKRAEYDLPVPPPGPGFGDSIGAMTIAGGIMGALFHRERTGQATTVDISLLGTGLWSMGLGVALSLLSQAAWSPPSAQQTSRNPLVESYLTQDGRHVALCCLQAGQYWAALCECVGRPELADDPRFADHESLLANGGEALAILADVFASATLAEWRERLEPFVGQWAVVQDTLEAGQDAQALANGYIQSCATADGTPFELVSVPVQYDEQPAPARRAPEFNEHGDDLLAEIGLDWDAVVDLKVRGVVA